MEVNASQILQNETQKYFYLSRAFLFKAMELIYTIRCPNEISDFKDDENWFSLNIQMSPSIRQHVMSRLFHGYIRLDIKISDPDEIIESWYITHLPYKPGETIPIIAENQQDVKQHIYHSFSVLMRSIFSILHALPAYTLQSTIGHLTFSQTKFTAECSTFKQIPVKIIPSQFKTANFKYGPVITPIGKTYVICKYAIDTIQFIPRPINFVIKSEKKAEQSVTISLIDKEEDFGSSYLSPSPALSQTLDQVCSLTSFRPDPLDHFLPLAISTGIPLINRNVEMEKIETFIEIIEKMKVESQKLQPEPFTIDETKIRFDHVKLEIKRYENNE